MKRLISFFTRLCEAYLPDAFVFSLLLTLIVFVAAWGITPHSGIDLISFWGKDFWSLNSFAMQMIFVLITGHMLATTPIVGKGLSFLTSLIKTEKGALVLLSVISSLACWINWGFGLIVAGVLAVEFSRKLGKVNFGLFVATAYSGFLVWHAGLSGSIPLKIAGNDETINKVFPGLSIPLTQTIFSGWNLTLVVFLILTMPLLALWMMTDDKVEAPVVEVEKEEIIETGTFRDTIENSRILNIVFFIFFVIVVSLGGPLDFNRVNLIFLALALFFHGTPRRFLFALQKSFGFASGIAIQFPFYAGLMGIMQHSGLADQISLLFIRIATADTLAIWTFYSAAFVNFFIPSGGGQWVVQGPIMLKAAKELGVDPAKISMALAWGDACTNLIQPFWVLPIIALAGLKLKDIMGYCLMYVLYSGLIISAFLYFV